MYCVLLLEPVARMLEALLLANMYVSMGINRPSHHQWA